MSVIGFHLIFTGYGHWLPNDPRGSGSRDIRNELLALLGPTHPGRKKQQPPRAELKSFYRRANPILQHAPLWFDESTRSLIAGTVAATIASRRYTCWAGAILTNHMHLCVRRHRDNDEVIWLELAAATARVVRTLSHVPAEHRVWADRPYAIFLETPEDIRRVVDYIAKNPAKEGLKPQCWPFVLPYDDWPFHKVQ